MISLDGDRIVVRELIEDRYKSFLREKERLFNEVLTGGRPGAQRGWYVAPPEEIRARAAELGTVEVIENRDGSVSLRLLHDLRREEEHLQEFILQEFLSDQATAVLWALAIEGVPKEAILRHEERIRKLAADATDRRESQTLLGLFLLNKASAVGGSYHIAAAAVDLFAELRQADPEEPRLAEYHARALHLRSVFDW